MILLTKSPGSYKKFQGRNPCNIFVAIFVQTMTSKDILKLTDLYLAPAIYWLFITVRRVLAPAMKKFYWHSAPTILNKILKRPCMMCFCIWGFTCNLHPQFQIPNASHLYLSAILFILINLVTRHCILALNYHNFFISMTSRRISQLWKVTHNLFFLSIQEDQIIWNVEMCGQTAKIYNCVQTVSWNVSTGGFLISEVVLSIPL